MGETSLKQCLRCGSENRTRGNLIDFGTSKFRPKGFWNLVSSPVDAVACQNCGHIELILEPPPRQDAM
jgi:hypothetical protein